MMPIFETRRCLKSSPRNTITPVIMLKFSGHPTSKVLRHEDYNQLVAIDLDERTVQNNISTEGSNIEVLLVEL